MKHSKAECLTVACRLAYALTLTALLNGCRDTGRKTETANTAPAMAPIKVELVERFGVSHPDQLVTFALPAKVEQRQVTLTDAQGNAVPFQIVNNGTGLVVRTDLPAGATRAWTLQPGSDTAPRDGQVKIIRRADNTLEMDNGLVAIRLPQAGRDLSAWTPAPIQGIRDRDGIWFATGSNAMSRVARKMTVDIIENGPLLGRVRISYNYDRRELRSHRPELPVIPAGEGSYSVLIEIQAGQPVVLFEEDCDVDVDYSVSFGPGWRPDIGRYRGHHASKPERGREPDGQVYRPGHMRPPMDATVDIPYDGTKDGFSNASLPFVAHWDPWATDTGFYWQICENAANSSQRVAGLFSGRASRLLSPGVSGVAFDTETVRGSDVAGLRMKFQRLMPTQYYTTHIRFGWGLFLGRKHDDWRAPTEVQTIGRLHNIHSGFNLNATCNLPADFPDPPNGYGSLYMPATALEPLKRQLQEEKRNDPQRPLFYKIHNDAPYYKDLLEYWSQPDATNAAVIVERLVNDARTRLEALVNGVGLYGHSECYFMGAIMISQDLARFDQLLADTSLDSHTRSTLKSIMTLFAAMLWDDDLAPMQRDADNRNLSGMNWGPANMFSMWVGTRHSYTLLLARHPAFAPYVPAIKQETINQVLLYINNDGACSASAHYTEPSMVPTMNMIMQLQQAGVGDLFAELPRLRRYAEWEMQLTTPPDPRFNRLRKIIALGDGSTEASPRLSQLATAIAQADSSLSARAMGIWREMGEPMNAFFGFTAQRYDSRLPTAPANLGDDQFEGYCTVLRNCYGTAAETAAWFVNGMWYADHRHNDAGSFILYALGAPISIDWGPIYYPRVGGGLMHSAVMPESALPQPWDQDNTPLEEPACAGANALWSAPVAAPLASFTASSWGDATFYWQGNRDKGPRWRRAVRLLRHPEHAPFLLIEDQVYNPGDGEPPVAISTINLMATGTVTTAQGAVMPPARLYNHNDATQNALPSALPGVGLAAGLSRFGFTGQYGVDFDVLVAAGAGTQASLGNWGHCWHPSPEQRDYMQAHNGEKFTERQHILRLRAQGSWRTLIMPYRRGGKPMSAGQKDDAIVLRDANGLFIITPNGYVHQDKGGAADTITSFGAAPHQAAGFAISGGAAEIILSADTGRLTIHGSSGERKVRLATPWTIAAAGSEPPPAKGDDGEWVIPWSSGKQLTLKLTKEGQK